MKQTIKQTIETLIEENRCESFYETLRNLTRAIELVSDLDTGRLTRIEQQVLNQLGREKTIALYCEAIKIITKNAY